MAHTEKADQNVSGKRNESCYTGLTESNTGTENYLFFNCQDAVIVLE